MKTSQTVTILVGPPCCGKSTYVAQHKSLFDWIISSDDIVTKLCEQQGLKYSDYFKLKPQHPLKLHHEQQFEHAIDISKQKQNIVWDLTSLTKADRYNIKSHYPNAQFIAVEFDWQNSKEQLRQRNIDRNKTLRKHIPEDVLTLMFNKYQPVSDSEDFYKVIYV